MTTARISAVLFAFLATAACVQLPPDEGPQPFGATDRELEREIALQAQESIQKDLRLYPDPVVQAYVRRIGRKIAAVTDRRDLQWTFGVIDDDTMNAFTVGDGKVYLFKGLLDKLENEAQVASVVGHEIAHVTRFHTVVTARKAQETQAIAGLAGAVLGGEGVAELAVGVAGTIIQSGFSRDQEDQADRVGMTYTYRAGYDVREFPKVFEIFAREGGDRPQLYNDLFGSHSTNRDRIANTRKILGEKYLAVQRNPYLGREAHQRIRSRLR